MQEFKHVANVIKRFDNAKHKPVVKAVTFLTKDVPTNETFYLHYQKTYRES